MIFPKELFQWIQRISRSWQTAAAQTGSKSIRAEWKSRMGGFPDHNKMLPLPSRSVRQFLQEVKELAPEEAFTELRENITHFILIP